MYVSQNRLNKQWFGFTFYWLLRYLTAFFSCCIFLSAGFLSNLEANKQMLAGMDRLFHAARIGNVQDLHQVLSEHPLILHQVPLICAENPLHFSCAAGHFDFTKKILELKPEFAGKLNVEGYNPLHLASANGYVEMVKEIIRVDRKACHLEGSDKKTPLHLAVLNGKIEVIYEILANCQGCLEYVTVQKETALHLAAKVSQFGSLHVMLDWIRKMKKEEILNMKDERGNTILHLAIWKKQRQVAEWLLSNGAGTLEVNAINKNGSTALDLLLMFPSEAGDREIQEILQGCGALRAQDLTLPLESSSSLALNPADSSPSSDLIEFFRFHNGRDSPSDVRTTLLVIAVLVATATYQVGISPPGGAWQDDQKGHIAGTSILGTHDVVSYILLISFNSIGFFVSIYVIGTLTSKFPLRTELGICLTAVYLTYNFAVSAIAPGSAKVFTIVFTSVLPTAVPVAGSLLRKYTLGQRIIGWLCSPGGLIKWWR